MNEELPTNENLQKDNKVRIRGFVIVLFLPGLIGWSVTAFIPVFPAPCIAISYLLLGIAVFAYIMERINQPQNSEDESANIKDF